MGLDIILFLSSLVGLVYGADKLVEEAVVFARRLGLSTLFIGLTIIAIGTSLPEIASSLAAALKGHPGIVLGNVLGSNACNIGLVLGVAALSSAITCHPQVVRREGMAMLFVTGLLWMIGVLAGQITQMGGVMLLLLFFLFLSWVYRNTTVRQEILERVKNVDAEDNQERQESEEESGSDEGHIVFGLLRFIVFLALILISSEFLIRSTVNMAGEFGVSESVIALSLIAFGTSLPELAVSIASARRGEGDILVGNIIGSNVSNILLVLGISAAAHPIMIPKQYALSLDIPFISVLSLLMIFFLATPKGITRPKAIFFLSLYSFLLLRCVLLPL